MVALHGLSRHRLLEVLLGIVVVSTIVAWLPVPDAKTTERLFVLVVQPALLLSVVALYLAVARSVRHVEQRRFLNLIAASFAAWFVSSLAGILIPMEQTLSVLYPVQDSLLVVFYCLVFLATAAHPEWPSGWSKKSVGAHMESLGTVVLLCALLVYFAVLPANVHPGEYTSLVPSYLLIVLLDLGLVWRFGALRRQARAAKWRTVYDLLLATAVLWTVFDVLEGLMELEIIPLIPQGHPLDVFWSLSYITAAFAATAQLGSHQEPGHGGGHGSLLVARRGLRRLSTSLIVFGFAFPVVHLSLSRLGVLEPGLQPLREITVLLTLLALFTITLVQHRAISRETLALDSELENAQRQLEHTARLESIGRVTAGVAHDFNNLLTVILGHTDIVLESLPESSASRVQLAEARNAGDRAAALTHRLLAFSRSQPLQPVAASIDDLVLDVTNLASRILGEDVRIELDQAGELPPVRIDVAGFEQVLMNLLVNARDAMPDGGIVTIRTRTAPATEIRQEDGAVYRGEAVEISVEDEGTGVAEDIQHLIFEPFFTTKEVGKGTGLGLSTAYGTIRQSGGGISVANNPGRGAAFRIVLPT